MAPRALILDVTRLISRIGKGALTGIDRVELAYARHLPAAGLPLFGLLRTGAGVLLLPSASLAQICAWADGQALPNSLDLISRLSRRDDPPRLAMEAALRQQAVARAPVGLAGWVLRRHLPPGSAYLNVGHANLSGRMMRALRRSGRVRIAVLLHDVIPLDYPQFARADQVPAFARKLQTISRYADLVIHTAKATRQANEVQLRAAGHVPPGIVAPLGIVVTPPRDEEIPAELSAGTPYFVVLGTIEPRKNHSLLLDVWQGFTGLEPPPRLLILGNKGWAGAPLMARLEAGVPGVEVISGLGDGAVSALISGAHAVLFPTLAEGFGLPAFEAAALGTPVIASDLPVLREFLAEFPVYLDPTDSYSWSRTILDHFLQPRKAGSDEAGLSFPSWEEHFRIVLTSF